MTPLPFKAKKSNCDNLVCKELPNENPGYASYDFEKSITFDACHLLIMQALIIHQVILLITFMDFIQK